MKKALITGVTGQDGSYLAELLLEKGYEVHGIKRRASLFNAQRVDHIYQDPHELHARFVLHYGDLTDSSNLTRIMQQVQPDEVYNLGAQSHVAVSFESPEYTADVDAMGTLRLLEAIRLLGLGDKTRFYQDSTSELYGLVQEVPQRETTPFYPRRPYAVATPYASWHPVKYTPADGMSNRGAQSHVALSFESPEYTAEVDAMGTLRLLEAIRLLGMGDKTRFYQASTSELYGLVQEVPQRETTPFYPRSPYAVAKLYAYWITVNYREAYGMYACNGILFNHESPRRGETFVTRKITRGLANIAQGLDRCLFMGNLDALRDWGHAKDYVRMQWMMLQQDNPQDYVIATGQQYSVREFIRWSAQELGVTLKFEGQGVEEKGIVESVEGDKTPALKAGDVVVAVDPRYFRPAEVETLLGDPSKARRELGWTPEITAQEMCAEMVAADLLDAQRHALLQEHGYHVSVAREA